MKVHETGGEEARGGSGVRGRCSGETLRKGSARCRLIAPLAAEAITAATDTDRALTIYQALLLPHFTDGEAVAGATPCRVFRVSGTPEALGEKKEVETAKI